MTVDSDQDRLMVAFNTVPARLWVGSDPDWSLYAISARLAVMTGECPVHGHHHDVVLSLVNGQLHALGEASDPEQLGRLLVSHACLDQDATRALLADYRAARVAPSGGIAMVRIGEVPGDPDGIAVSTTGRPVGALSVYATQPCPWSAIDVAAVGAYGGVVAELVAASMALGARDARWPS